MSISLESRCPSCHKDFPNDSLVLRHMNNPRTSCQSWLQFLSSIDLGVSGHSTTVHPSTRSGTNDAANRNENSSDNDTSTATHYEDVHPNTPSFFGSGPAFMDKFSTDPYADKRRENLYYPFLSKGEWALASWLICSGLSMRAIDDLLALPIVSFQAFVTTFFANQVPRYNSFRSPSPLQKHYVVVWTSFPRPPNGRCKKSRSTDTTLQSRSHFFTAIPSNASRPSYKTRSLKESGILSPKGSMMVLTERTDSTMNGWQVTPHGPPR